MNSFVISQELNKTHIWQDLVNSDRQLAIERENKYSKASKSSKKRKNNAGPSIDEDVHLPLIVSSANTPIIQKSQQPQQPQTPSIPKNVVGNMTRDNENSKL